jgi:hypothetical protein
MDPAPAPLGALPAFTDAKFFQVSNRAGIQNSLQKGETLPSGVPVLSRV